MKKVDKEIAAIRKLQEEIDRRTRIENEAIQLISESRFDEAMKLLASLE